MRSRYSAYAQANIAYIQKSMCGKAAEGFEPTSAKQWAESVTWLGLTVKQSYLSETNPELAYVEFVAGFKDEMGIEQEITELSEFRKINDQWYYVDGKTSAKSMNSVYTSDTLMPKIGRNDPCPCGSGKKFKKCCLLK